MSSLHHHALHYHREGIAQSLRSQSHKCDRADDQEDVPLLEESRISGDTVGQLQEASLKDVAPSLGKEALVEANDAFAFNDMLEASEGVRELPRLLVANVSCHPSPQELQGIDKGHCREHTETLSHTLLEDVPPPVSVRV